MTKLIDFSKYSSIKIGPKIEVEFINEFSSIDDKSYIIGGCSNLLIGNNPPKLIALSKTFDYIKLNGDILTIGGATPSGKIFSFCKRNDIKGFEFLSHLPGKLGGLVKMNAGMKQYEIFNNLLFIKTKKEILQKQDIDFGYRYAKIDDIIIEASFLAKKGFDFQKTDMFKNLRKNQPKNPNAGSCFKNPPKNFAGELIEKVGLKGKKMGGMAFSPLHANFLVNLDNGSFEDAITLINEAKKRVFEQFGIMLELEIKILDKDFL